MSSSAQQHEATFAEGAKHLLLTAERLFSEQGIESVSTRMISRESGQKNHSALQYHFGSRDGLIEAILNYRISPVNQERSRRLTLLKRRGRNIDVEQLVRIFVEPFSEELLKPLSETAYVSLLAQLYSYQRGRELFAKNKERTRALHDITALLIRALEPMEVPVIHLRLQLLGRQTITAIAEWDDARRNHSIELDETAWRWRTDNLIEFLVGGLTAKK
jgi:AcrR family transcriptional regulator